MLDIKIDAWSIYKNLKYKNWNTTFLLFKNPYNISHGIPFLFIHHSTRITPQAWATRRSRRTVTFDRRMKSHPQVHRGRQTPIDPPLVTSRMWQDLARSCHRELARCWVFSSVWCPLEEGRCRENHSPSPEKLRRWETDDTISRWDT